MCRTGVLLDSSLLLLVTRETQGLETSERSLQSPQSLEVDLKPYICPGSHRPPAVRKKERQTHTEAAVYLHLHSLSLLFSHACTTVCEYGMYICSLFELDSDENILNKVKVSFFFLRRCQLI